MWPWKEQSRAKFFIGESRTKDVLHADSVKRSVSHGRWPLITANVDLQDATDSPPLSRWIPKGHCVAFSPLSPKIQNSTHKHWGRCLLDEMMNLRYWTTSLILNFLVIWTTLSMSGLSFKKFVLRTRVCSSNIHSFIEIHPTSSRSSSTDIFFACQLLCSNGSHVICQCPFFNPLMHYVLHLDVSSTDCLRSHTFVLV